MPIVNFTKKMLITHTFEECSTFWEQMKGMMFRDRVVPLLFRFPKAQELSLHSWFCPDAMDLVFLDESWTVVEVFSEWETRSSYKNSQPAMFLLELPVGTIARTNTEVGDVVHITK
jgi:uncharacterized membrane protein (UPF0127 family)